jgi:hypothetical protein
MARFGACIGCASTGGGGSGTGGLFSSSPLDLFSHSSKATTGGTAATGPVIDTQYDCPEVKIRSGAATLMIGDKPGQGEPAALDVRYQGSILRTARECHLAGNIMTMKVGIEGRVITGPAGGPGTVNVPLRVAVVYETLEPTTVVTKLAVIPVVVNNAVDRVTFTHVEPDLTFPLPQPMSKIYSYVIYVGFDPQGAEPQKAKRPARKARGKTRSKPKAKR